MIEQFENFIKSQSILCQQDKLLLAVSGGVDSIVMCHLFYILGIKFGIAHCNYGLRGAESVDDEALIHTLANDYGADCFVKNIDTILLKKSRQSIQMLARELRYSWFKELCVEYGFTKLATAHHLNDCIETSLLNLCRGTGIRGLHSLCNDMSHKTNIIRPLLFATKNEIYEYAKANELTWREDSSNAKNNYKRNLIRNTVVPVLKTLNPNLERTMASSLERIEQVDALWLEYLENLREEIVTEKGDLIYLNLDKILKKSWAKLTLFELVKKFGFSYQQIQDFMRVAHNSGSRIMSRTHTLHADRKVWIITSTNTAINSNDFQLIYSTTDSIDIEMMHLQMQTVDASLYTLDRVNNLAALDKDVLKFPLIIRKWQIGDSFYPLGMKNRKKVSDFLIDAKVSIPEKQNVYVLVSEGHIIWLVGYRIDERYKVNEKTKTIYEIKKCPRHHYSI